MGKMKERISAGDIYVKLCAKKKSVLQKVTVENVMSLFEALKDELLMEFHSDFFDACYINWQEYCLDIRVKDLDYQPVTFNINTAAKMYDISSYDAIGYIHFLGLYLCGNDITEKVQNWLNNGWGEKRDFPQRNHGYADEKIVRIDKKLLELHNDYIEGNNAICEMVEKTNRATAIITKAKKQEDEIIGMAKIKARQIIDEAESKLQLAKELRMEGEQSANKMREDAQADAETLKKHGNEILKSAQRKAEETIANARTQADEIIVSAKVKADEISQKAERIANEKVSEGTKRANELMQKVLIDSYKQEQEKLEASLNRMKEEFIQVQSSMRTIEDEVTNMHVRKIFDNYYSLYGLIEQSKSAFVETLYSDDENKDYSFVVENLEVYLDVLTEGLGAFGVNRIISSSGTPFDGNIHDAKNITMFDPNDMVVEKSIQSGFVFGQDGIVLKKEKVTIRNKNC